MIAELVQFLSGPAALFVLGGWYVALVGGERLAYWIQRRPYNDPDARCGVALNLTNSVVNLLGSVLFPIALYLNVYDQFRMVETMPLGVAVVVAFLWHDFAYYAEHRLAHRVGILWALHSVHHASNEFNHSVAARGTAIDGLMNAPWHIPAALLGIPPAAYAAVTVAKQAFGIWNHASWVGHLGRLEMLLCTPQNHKIHHANQPQYIDRNYGQVLLLWDRLFRTHAPYTIDPVPGLVEPIANTNPFRAQVTGFQWLSRRIAAAPRWKDKIAYLWKPPEWSHDGVCHSSCPKYAAFAIQ